MIGTSQLVTEVLCLNLNIHNIFVLMGFVVRDINGANKVKCKKWMYLYDLMMC